MKVLATADVAEQVVAGGGKLAKMAEWAEKTTIGGYGEYHFNHFNHFNHFEDNNDKIDAHRYVLYFVHQYSDHLRFFSEFELEHGNVGEAQPGEVELE
jgi:hypothetical protein